MTITEAIKQVMRANGTPMTAEEAYKGIVAANLYEFHADNPAGIVQSQIRRHCEGLDFPSGSPTKHFKLVGDGRYLPLAEVIRGPRKPRQNRAARSTPKLRFSTKSVLPQLQLLHAKYVSELKQRIPVHTSDEHNVATTSRLRKLEYLMLVALEVE